MKKVFGILVPLLIIFVIGVVLTVAFLAGKKGVGCNPNSEPGVVAGKNESLLWINAIENYKLTQGRYPVTFDELDQSTLRIGKGYSHPNIQGISPIFSDGNSFSVSFNFTNDYVCPLGQSRKCTYKSDTKDWTCQ